MYLIYHVVRWLLTAYFTYLFSECFVNSKLQWRMLEAKCSLVMCGVAHQTQEMMTTQQLNTP